MAFYTYYVYCNYYVYCSCFLLKTHTMKKIFKLLIITVLCLFIGNCRSSYDTTKKHKKERTDTTDDVVDEQKQDYEEAMKQ